MRLAEFQNRYMQDFETYLLQRASAITKSDTTLYQSMAYSLTNGGKRVRPLLLLATLYIAGTPIQKGLAAAAALEFVHTYSLIHDDLPAMDNDDYRRGQLTNHKKFNEATAILAGDALLTGSFEVILADEHNPADINSRLALWLAQAAGGAGMIAGQMEDIEGEERKLTLSQLTGLHQKKTGCLIEYAVAAGCLVAGTEDRFTAAAKKFAAHMGLAFQIHNDLKDVLMEETVSGKAARHDEELNKNTYPSLLGIEGAQQALTAEIAQAEEQLKKLEQMLEEKGQDQSSIRLFEDLLAFVKL